MNKTHNVVKGYLIAIPERCKIYKRVYKTRSDAELSHYYVEGAVLLPTEPKYVTQYARYAYDLMRVNERYVTCPGDFVAFIKGPNWNNPDVEYSHEEDYVALFGRELVDELNEIRALSDECAVSRMRKLVEEVGISVNE